MNKPIDIPRFGFGGAGLGNLSREVSDDEAHRTLQAAWDGDLRYFDTSPLYGFGLSELRVGSFLRRQPRAEYVLSTKVGRYMVPPRGRSYDRGMWTAPLDLMPVHDYSYDATMRSLEQSHSRLGLADIDIVYIHDVDRRNLGADFDRHYRAAIEGAYRALDELRSQGFVKAIGIGINESDVAADFMAETDLDLVMLAGRYTLIEQPALADCLPMAEKKGVGIVNVGVFNSGVLAKGVSSATYDYGAVPQAVIEKVRSVERVCGSFGITMPAAAAQFSLGHPAIASVVFGMTRPQNVEQTLAYLKEPVPAAFWQALADEGIIGADVPVPAASATDRDR
ncbi:MAG: pyridoxal 4-dehydrogenase [Rhizobiales bacterium]|nr:pyridoxal 4-dehydrogenase [Hyphomicrobiales bacterium]|tara:strand:+ start:15177 stop:16187 length:1011 start_codon:yes stop_codon:yes gene_type:complete